LVGGFVLRRWTGGLLVVGVLTACAPERGGALPDPSREPSVPSASVSVRPLTRAELEAQALAAVQNYYASIDSAIRTGETQHLSTLVTADCVCGRMIRFIADVWKEGTVRGSRFFVVDTAKVRDFSPGVVVLDVSVSGDAYEIVRKDGSVTQRYPADRGKRVVVTTIRRDEKWLIQDIAVFSR
jgi:hypothetical protein